MTCVEITEDHKSWVRIEQTTKELLARDVTQAGGQGTSRTIGGTMNQSI